MFKSSRFSRDTLIVEQYLNDKLLEWGIRFIGVADNADTENESYRAIRLFTSAYNEMYVKDISAKTRRIISHRMHQMEILLCSASDSVHCRSLILFSKQGEAFCHIYLFAAVIFRRTSAYTFTKTIF